MAGSSAHTPASKRAPPGPGRLAPRGRARARTVSRPDDPTSAHVLQHRLVAAARERMGPRIHGATGAKTAERAALRADAQLPPSAARGHAAASHAQSRHAGTSRRDRRSSRRAGRGRARGCMPPALLLLPRASGCSSCF